MIYLTGDCHGDFHRFARRQREKLSAEPGEGDQIIVCGDLGLLWARDRELTYNLKWLSKLPFTLLWVQGNHENYDLIAEYPMEQWNGGKVRHILRDKIILLERGQIFEIEGKRFFTFGGASSHDIQGGILDRDSPTYAKERKRANQKGLSYRVRNVSWWEQELPSEAEMQEGRENLSRAGYEVDYVITHCLSGSMQEELDRYFGIPAGNRTYEPDILTDYFEELEKQIRYRCWFCGHYHVNLVLDERHRIFYEEIACLQDC